MTRTAPTKTLVEALALAAAAYRINNNFFVSSRNWYTGMKHNDCEVSPNSSIMQRSDLVITEEDQALAQKMQSHFEGVLFKKLTRKLSDFENNIALLVDTNVVNKMNMGLVGYLPALYEREVKQELVDEELSSMSARPYGAVEERVKLDVKVIDKKYIHQYNTYLYTCVDKDNFIFKFFLKALVEAPQLTIRGKVKSYNKDKYGNIVTSLHYVKQI